jgi:hypothetical protein
MKSCGEEAPRLATNGHCLAVPHGVKFLATTEGHRNSSEHFCFTVFRKELSLEGTLRSVARITEQVGREET